LIQISAFFRPFFTVRGRISEYQISNPNNRPENKTTKRFKITIFFDNLKQNKKITPNKTERTDFFWKRTPKMRDRRISAPFEQFS
jgi:hypothetical protein